ncbi:MAG: hypothetical protein WBA61_03175 [Aequorivita sp.]
MKTYLLILFFSTVTFLGCSKKDDNGFTPTLPPITQTGENTFGCYVDGKLLIPRDGTGTFNSYDYGMIFWGSPSGFSYNEIDVRDFKSGNGGWINIHIVDLHENGEGDFIINESNCEDGIGANPNINIRVRWLDSVTQVYKWYCSIENGGTLEITRYDFENMIVSGTFNCIVANSEDPNDIIEITEGRFDIKWNELPSNFP